MAWTKEERAAYAKEYYAANREEARVRKAKWRESNRSRVQDYEKKRGQTEARKISIASIRKHQISELSDRYIKGLLRSMGFSTSQMTPELIELKRNVIKTERLCRQLKTS